MKVLGPIIFDQRFAIGEIKIESKISVCFSISYGTINPMVLPG
jgi:hypothetical protein